MLQGGDDPVVNPNHKSFKAIGRVAMIVVLDIIVINVAMILSLQLQYDMRVPRIQLIRFGNQWPIMTAIGLASFAACRMYRSLWEYAGVDELIQIILGTLLTVGGTYAFALTAFTIQPEPNVFLLRRTAYLIDWFLLVFLVCAERFSFRIIRRLGIERRSISKNNRRRVMVIGAGWGGSSVLREMAATGYRTGMPVLVVDDDPAKAGTRIGRVPVKYGVGNIQEYVKQFAIDDIVIAIPSASSARLREILEECTQTGCKLKMVPGLRDVTGGHLQLGAIRDVNISDLLCRDEVELDVASISGYLHNQVVLVTGGGGSIGSELCRQIARFSPSKLIIFDIYENNAYELCNELKQKYENSLDIEVLIGSVRDKLRLDQVFREYAPAVVFHAAAHKHVPLMEDSPAEAVKNNVFGTLNVARCCDQYGVDRFVQLSTDKAVNPTNIMGATKRVTELIMQYMCRRSRTHFMAVRFGNVLGSNGSVIPIFRRQIEAGGPVTVTHPDITRYFMTIPEAAQLVLQAGAINESGAVFVLDMGTPVKIVDLARNLIQLSGYVPDVDIKIDYIGLRPGEKLYEELIMSDERDEMKKTVCDKITVAHPVGIEDVLFEKILADLEETAENNPDEVEAQLTRLVPSFHRANNKNTGDLSQTAS